jgi:hypothetical protein
MNLIKNIYNAENTYGDSFHYPIKQINTKFNHIIEGRGLIPSITLRVIQIMINLFISTPLFIMGTIVKLCEFPFIAKYNRQIKETVEFDLKCSIAAGSSKLMFHQGWRMQEVSSSKTLIGSNSDAIKTALFSSIDNCTNAFQRVYYDVSCKTVNGNNERTITLSIFKRNTGLPN